MRGKGGERPQTHLAISPLEEPGSGKGKTYGPGKKKKRQTPLNKQNRWKYVRGSSLVGIAWGRDSGGYERGGSGGTRIFVAESWAPWKETREKSHHNAPNRNKLAITGEKELSLDEKGTLMLGGWEHNFPEKNCWKSGARGVSEWGGLLKWKKKETHQKEKKNPYRPALKT